MCSHAQLERWRWTQANTLPKRDKSTACRREEKGSAAFQNGRAKERREEGGLEERAAETRVLCTHHPPSLKCSAPSTHQAKRALHPPTTHLLELHVLLAQPLQLHPSTGQLLLEGRGLAEGQREAEEIVQRGRVGRGGGQGSLFGMGGPFDRSVLRCSLVFLLCLEVVGGPRAACLPRRGYVEEGIFHI